MAYKISVDLSAFAFTYAQIYPFLETPSHAFIEFEEFLTDPDYRCFPTGTRDPRMDKWESNEKIMSLDLWVFYPGDDNDPKKICAFVARANAALNLDFSRFVEFLD